MPFVDGHIDWLYHGASAVVKVRKAVSELHYIFEVLQSRVSASMVKVRDERRTVVGSEDRAFVTDLHGTLRIASVLGVDPRSRVLN